MKFSDLVVAAAATASVVNAGVIPPSYESSESEETPLRPSKIVPVSDERNMPYEIPESVSTYANNWGDNYEAYKFHSLMHRPFSNWREDDDEEEDEDEEDSDDEDDEDNVGSHYDQKAINDDRRQRQLRESKGYKSYDEINEEEEILDGEQHSSNDAEEDDEEEEEDDSYRLSKRDDDDENEDDEQEQEQEEFEQVSDDADSEDTHGLDSNVGQDDTVDEYRSKHKRKDYIAYPERRQPNDEQDTLMEDTQDATDEGDNFQQTIGDDEDTQEDGDDSADNDVDDDTQEDTQENTQEQEEQEEQDEEVEDRKVKRGLSFATASNFDIQDTRSRLLPRKEAAAKLGTKGSVTSNSACIVPLELNNKRLDINGTEQGPPPDLQRPNATRSFQDDYTNLGVKPVSCAMLAVMVALTFCTTML